MLAPHDVNVIHEVEKIKDVNEIKFQGDPTLIEIIGEEIDKIYIDQLKTISLSPASIQKHADLKYKVYTIHGTGVKLVPQALRGFRF